MPGLRRERLSPWRLHEYCAWRAVCVCLRLHGFACRWRLSLAPTARETMQTNSPLMRFFTLRCLTIPPHAPSWEVWREWCPRACHRPAPTELWNMAPQTRLTTRFCQRLGVLAPVVLAPMGGCAGGRLAAAVAGAGASPPLPAPPPPAQAPPAPPPPSPPPPSPQPSEPPSAIATATLATTCVAVAPAGGVGLVGSGGESLAYLRAEWAVAVSQPGVLRLGLTLP